MLIFFVGLYRIGDENHIFRPIQSARIATSIGAETSFSFTFGTIEIRAKMPRGDWITPAIIMLPTERYQYGEWPRSGHIVIASSRGNTHLNCNSNKVGIQQVDQGLFWGPTNRESMHLIKPR